MRKNPPERVLVVLIFQEIGRHTVRLADCALNHAYFLSQAFKVMLKRKQLEQCGLHFISHLSQVTQHSSKRIGVITIWNQIIYRVSPWRAESVLIQFSDMAVLIEVGHWVRNWQGHLLISLSKKLTF
ncbi:hypothetical protein SMZ19_003843 [Cronobacter sakazakii]|nr:hypothetical protein [Cronobacter sakazakii]